MPTVSQSVISLFLIMLLGFYGGKRKIITNEINKGLTEMLLQIILPLMILSSFAFTYNDSIKINILKTFYYSIFVYIIIIMVSWILTTPVRRDKGKRTILHFANVFTNTGFIGFPILNVVYGSEAVIYGSIFNVFFVLFLWTYGVILFKGKMEKGQVMSEILINPSVIAVYMGLIMVFFNIRLPEVLLSSAQLVGGMTGAMSMMIVGVLFSNAKIGKKFKDLSIYYGVFIKMVLIPMLVFFLSVLVKDRSMVTNTIIILVAMPTAAMTPIFADNFNVQRDYATLLMVGTTLASLITLPLLMELII